MPAWVWRDVPRFFNFLKIKQYNREFIIACMHVMMSGFWGCINSHSEMHMLKIELHHGILREAGVHRPVLHRSYEVHQTLF